MPRQQICEYIIISLTISCSYRFLLNIQAFRYYFPFGYRRLLFYCLFIACLIFIFSSKTHFKFLSITSVCDTWMSVVILCVWPITACRNLLQSPATFAYIIRFRYSNFYFAILGIFFCSFQSNSFIASVTCLLHKTFGLLLNQKEVLPFSVLLSVTYTVKSILSSQSRDSVKWPLKPGGYLVQVN